ncbi:MAG: hypothetical protein HY606_09595 [Planctomycetes bacterium]|nr:hypothetical protein [Planctomycetota bacterium]
MSRFVTLREFILSLKQTKTSSDSIELYSDRFGLRLMLKIGRPAGFKTWQFVLTKEDIQQLKNKFLNWYDLQLQSADYHRYVYPKDWIYEKLDK